MYAQCWQGWTYRPALPVDVQDWQRIEACYTEAGG